jgi:hypothetical protein
LLLRASRKPFVILDSTKWAIPDHRDITFRVKSINADILADATSAHHCFLKGVYFRQYAFPDSPEQLKLNYPDRPGFLQAEGHTE